VRSWPSALAQRVQAALRACGIEQHQVPAPLVEAFVDVMAQFAGEGLGHGGALKVVSLRCEHHQLACALDVAGHCVLAEIRRDDQGECQGTLAHRCRACASSATSTKPKVWRWRSSDTTCAPDIEGMFAVVRAGIQVDHAHRQGTGSGRRIPNAGEVNQVPYSEGRAATSTVAMRSLG